MTIHARYKKRTTDSGRACRGLLDLDARCHYETRHPMKRLMSTFISCLFVAPGIVGQTPPESGANSQIVTAAQINGTWRYRHNEFKIWALSHQKLKVEFSG